MIKNRHDFVSHQAGGCLRRSKAGSGSLSMLARGTWTNILENINKYCPIIWTNTSWIWLCFQINWELGPVWNWFGRERQSGWDLSWLTINLQQLSHTIWFDFGLLRLTVFIDIAKDCLQTGQEQACTMTDHKEGKRNNWSSQFFALLTLGVFFIIIFYQEWFVLGASVESQSWCSAPASFFPFIFYLKLKSDLAIFFYAILLLLIPWWSMWSTEWSWK